MIDWNKPIETVDGRKARLVETNATEPRIWHIVYVSSIADSYGFDDVFIVNNEGCRRDDRASDREREEPFIRNVRVKRDGWCRMFRERGKLIVDCDVVYSTKESAEAACRRHGGDPAFITWESEL